MKNKQGYVYIWTDAKTNMKYVGARKGDPATDTYICSSKPMLIEYNKRPDDFTRDIIFQGVLYDVSAVEYAVQKIYFGCGVSCYNQATVKYTRKFKRGQHKKVTTTEKRDEVVSLTKQLKKIEKAVVKDERARCNNVWPGNVRKLKQNPAWATKETKEVEKFNGKKVRKGLEKPTAEGCTQQKKMSRVPENAAWPCPRPEYEQFIKDLKIEIKNKKSDKNAETANICHS